MRRSNGKVDLKHIAPKLRPFAVAIETLKLDPNNANTHDAESLDAIAASLREFGQQLPILIGPGRIVKHGNGVLEAARDILGWKHIAGIASNLAGRHLNALAIALNQTPKFSRWNKPVLAEQIQGIAAESDALLASIGFGDDLEKILESLDGPSKSRPDPAAGKRTVADTQVTIGAYRFRVPRKVYDAWLETLRQAVGFDEASVIEELHRRLGL